MDKIQEWLEGLDEEDRKAARHMLKTQGEYAHDLALRRQEPFVIMHLDGFDDIESGVAQAKAVMKVSDDIQACPIHGKGAMRIARTRGSQYCAACNAESQRRRRAKLKDDPEYRARRAEEQRRYRAENREAYNARARERYRAKKEAKNG